MSLLGQLWQRVTLGTSLSHSSSKQKGEEGSDTGRICWDMLRTIDTVFTAVLPHKQAHAMVVGLASRLAVLDRGRFQVGTLEKNTDLVFFSIIKFCS